MHNHQLKINKLQIQVKWKKTPIPQEPINHLSIFNEGFSYQAFTFRQGLGHHLFIANQTTKRIVCEIPDHLCCTLRTGTLFQTNPMCLETTVLLLNWSKT